MQGSIWAAGVAGLLAVVMGGFAAAQGASRPQVASGGPANEVSQPTRPDNFSGIRNFILTSEPAQRFGKFQKRQRATHLAGSPIHIYGEPVNFGWTKEYGAFRFAVVVDVELERNDGRVVWSERNATRLNMVADEPRGDLFVTLNLTTPQAPAGAYVLGVRIRDLATGRSVEKRFPLEIVFATSRNLTG